MNADGFALVSGLRPEASGTEKLAALLGRIRETDFGRLFDIIVESEPFTPSQSGDALDPHTDDPYRYTPSGMSILHCVAPSDADGGKSIVVDGFAVAEHLRATEPEAFELLTAVSVPFVHRRAESVEQGAAVDLRASAPLVSLEDNGSINGIRFHERSMGVLRLASDIADAYYLALRSFASLINDPARQWQHKLAAGEAIVYDNQRVLHGRTTVVATTGQVVSRRHLRLCTIDRDQTHSILRRLRAEHGTGTADASLAAGNLS